MSKWFSKYYFADIILVGIIGIVIFLTCLCTTDNNTQSEPPFISVEKMTYEGHTYLKFYQNRAINPRYWQIIHDPECPKCDSINNIYLEDFYYDEL